MLRLTSAHFWQVEGHAYEQTPPEPPRQTQQRQQQAAETAPDFDPTFAVRLRAGEAPEVQIARMQNFHH